MIPDKIYVRPQAFETPWPPYIDENANYGGEQYIRKDALIEWLNRMLEISAQSLEFQRNYAYGKVIDKLNEM